MRLTPLWACNFGNILSCYYARKMGVPVGKLLCASNRNDVLTDFIRTGVYDRNRPFHTTMSPSRRRGSTPGPPAPPVWPGRRRCA